MATKLRVREQVVQDRCSFGIRKKMTARIATGALSFMGVFAASMLVAQPQLDNPSFESWNNVDQATEEPVDWSSLKTSDGGFIINSLVPQLCWRSSIAHTGAYSVNLRTVSSAAGNANGLLTNGRVHAELAVENSYMFTVQGDAQWNTTMTSRPDSIVGWFRADPEVGDRPNIGALLHVDDGRLPAFGTEGNYVAGASWKGPYAQVTEWTRFSAPFEYLNDSQPEWILLILTAGDSAGSQVGTQVWYDDLALIYNLACDPSVGVATVSATDPFAFDVDYSTGGVPLSPTEFTVELSDASGSFAAPLVIGSLTSTSASGSIPCIIPGGTAQGTGYRIRVVAPSTYYAPVGCGIEIALGTSLGEHAGDDVRVIASSHGLRIDVDAPARYECYDVRGRAVATGVLRTGLNTVDLQDHHGVMLVRVVGAATTFTQRVLVP